MGINIEDWAKIDQIFMEVHDVEGGRGRVKEIIDLLNSHGYRAVAEQDQLLEGTDRFNLYATRRNRQLQSTNLSLQRLSVNTPDDLGMTEAETIKNIRKFMRDSLPQYMVPSAIVILKE